MSNIAVAHNRKGHKNSLHESNLSNNLMTALINYDDDPKDNESCSDITILIPSDLSDHPVSTSTDCKQNGSMRIFVIGLMSISIFIQACSQSVWGAIHESASLAFPNRTRRPLSLLPVWGSVITAILIIPACVVINKCGLRLSLLFSCCFHTLGTAVRCMPTMYSCTLCLHLSAIFLSVGGVVMTPLIITMSALWFPENERNMATGFCFAARMLGSAATGVIGPYLVPAASDGPEKPFLTKIFVTRVLYACLIMNGLTTVSVYFAFPSGIHRHNCSSYYEWERSTETRRNAKLSVSIKTLVTNRNALYLVLAFTLSNLTSVPWVSLMPSIFHHRLHAPPEFANQCNVFTIIHVFALNLAFSKCADNAPAYRKQIMLGCHFISTFFAFWLMMEFSFNAKLTLTVLNCLVLVAFPYSWGCQPLFYEMGAKLMYPVPESFIAGYMTAVNDVSIDFVYATLYFFPHFGSDYLSIFFKRYTGKAPAKNTTDRVRVTLKDEYWLHVGVFVCSVLSLLFLCLVSDDNTEKERKGLLII